LGFGFGEFDSIGSKGYSSVSSGFLVTNFDEKFFGSFQLELMFLSLKNKNRQCYTEDDNGRCHSKSNGRFVESYNCSEVITETNYTIYDEVGYILNDVVVLG
jgi:hypothetical protein